MKHSTVIDNRTLVQEEQLGYASQYLVEHQTTLRDAAVRDMLTKMSFEEIVS